MFEEFYPYIKIKEDYVEFQYDPMEIQCYELHGIDGEDEDEDEEYERVETPEHNYMLPAFKVYHKKNSSALYISKNVVHPNCNPVSGSVCTGDWYESILNQSCREQYDFLYLTIKNMLSQGNLSDPYFYTPDYIEYIEEFLLQKTGRCFICKTMVNTKKNQHNISICNNCEYRCMPAVFKSMKSTSSVKQCHYCAKYVWRFKKRCHHCKSDHGFCPLERFNDYE